MTFLIFCKLILVIAFNFKVYMNVKIMLKIHITSFLHKIFINVELV